MSCGTLSYESAAYVARASLEREFDAWALSPQVPERVLSVVAAPGTGKSWLLRAVRDRWVTRDGDGLLVFLLDVPLLFAKGGAPPPTGQLNRIAILHQLQELRKTAVRLCPRVREIDPDIHHSASIAALVSDICERGSDRTLVILIDGYDEITQAQTRALDKEVLDHFFTRDCVRLAIARRSQSKLTSDTLRRNERLLDLAEKISAQRQFELFKNQYYPLATHLDKTSFPTWMAQLTSYQWDHPYLNAFLFCLGLEHTANPMLTAADLFDCCMSVVERPDEHGVSKYGLSSDTRKLFIKIGITLRDEWDGDDLHTGLGHRPSDPMMKPLFDYGVIANIPFTPLYKMDASLRLLLLDWQRLGGTV